MSLFVDTSTLYASLDSSDASHERAREVLTAAPEALLTTDHVLVECWLLANARAGHGAAEAAWAAIRAASVRIEPVGAVDLEAARRIGEKFGDQRFSIVDRTSFAVMERLGLTRVASLDDDFAIYRFGPRRDRAFEVVR